MSAQLDSLNLILNFAKDYPRISLDKGDIFVQQDTEPDYLYAVSSGFVKVNDIASSGSEQLIWLAKKYDIVPLEWLDEPALPTPFFYSAYTDTTLVKIPVTDFREFINKNPRALKAIVSALIKKHNHMLQQVNANKKQTAEEKIVYMIRYLVVRFGQENGNESAEIIKLPLTHQDIADLVGLSRKTISLELVKLKKQKIIDYGHDFFTINKDKIELKY